MPATTDVVAEHEAMAQRYGEAWNSQDLDAIVSAHAEDGIYQLHVGEDPFEGREAIGTEFARIIAQLPDIHFEPKRLIATEAGWTLESTMSGTLSAPGELDGEEVGSAGAKVAVDCLDLIVVSDGAITEKHTYLDSVTLLRQAGGR
ncbi:MAG TPA: nuclear transport factor 2 family protein [Solirubrobacterales bacterium]|jgi:steroid delta-isomerase-like uncharacterized protein|nr:nuclear transport factor 2 family protein [Solirubrobacterales bacterium]